MDTYIINEDVDRIVCVHLTYYQVLRMSEVNAYHNQLLTNRRQHIKSIGNNFALACGTYDYQSIIEFVNQKKRKTRGIFHWLIPIECFVDIHQNKEEPFRKACHNGNFEAAKWLYGLGKRSRRIDINAESDDAFVGACASGHLPMAQWLLELSESNQYMCKSYGGISHKPINIHANSEKPFRLACVNGHTNIAQWLFQTALQSGWLNN